MHYCLILMIVTFWISLINIAYTSARNFGSENKPDANLTSKVLSAAIPDSRIFGGRSAIDGEIPYVVSVQYDIGIHFCGGSIISETSILTAAHCVNDRTRLDTLQIAAGSIYLCDFFSARIFVSEIIYHPEYNSTTLVNDLAVLKLESELPLLGHVSRIKIAKRISDGVRCIVSGWGKTEDSSISPILKVATVRIVNMDECIRNYTNSIVRDKMICASDYKTDSCQGDSGGPLVCHGNLVGIVSWGAGCAEENFPGVYTNALYYSDWISTVARSNRNLKIDLTAILLLLFIKICVQLDFLYRY